MQKNFPEPAGYAGQGTPLFEIKALETDNLRTLPYSPEQAGQMLWVTKGHLEIMFEMETHELRAGTTLFLTPGQAYYIRFASPDLEGLVLRFPVGFMPTGSDLPYPDLTFRISRIFEVDEWTTVSMMSIIQCMRQEMRNKHSRNGDVLAVYLKIVLIHLARQQSVELRASFRADMAVLARRFFDLLERQYHVNKKVSEYADELAVTPNYLNQIVKQETGMSVSANIRRRLLLQAKRMALIQGINMKTVAYKLGFDDTAHFSKFFKMGCGCTFTSYKKCIPSAAHLA
ncbi:transcriptional regulator [Dyadobacter beijingensis]|uniref:Transcriptional regulator n=2 Tax=Dyadobacter beijingensis TaxID=365489 RepID=A0ABQ2ILX4_9BACT|nr:transcriptional regulator [Dyadobacter beijingensis]